MKKFGILVAFGILCASIGSSFSLPIGGQYQPFITKENPNSLKIGLLGNLQKHQVNSIKFAAGSYKGQFKRVSGKKWKATIQGYSANYEESGGSATTLRLKGINGTIVQILLKKEIVRFRNRAMEVPWTDATHIVITNISQ
ncbi:MAG: hypothetical protein AB8B94_11075 [Hyphomicrobiales bacterium]